MQVRLLGPLTVDDGGNETEVRGTRQQGLLALLALHGGTVLSNDQIIDELWGDDTPESPVNALQAVVSRVRKVVGPSTLVARGGGYALDVPADAVDALRFERMVTDARAELAAGSTAAASATLDEALALWRGPPLEGLGDLAFARAAVVRLRELRGVAIDTRADAELASGHHRMLVADLRAAVDEEPLRESTWSRLMLALYRCGRQAEALRSFQEARRILGEELGIEPGPELRAMESAILSQSPELEASPDHFPTPAASQVEAPPPAGSGASPRRLPRPRTSFVGRVAELDRLDGALTENQLVTLVGPGGVGKTRLATELATRRSRNGERVVFVDLSSVASDDDVAEEAAVALGGRDRPASPGGSVDALEHAAAQVATGPVLVVVDNCEHVIEAAARAVETVIDASDKLRVVATSREALGVPGEQLHPLRPLTIEESASLFVDRARAVRPDFEPTPPEEQRIAEVCVRLDALPLAIELAAARVLALPVEEIAARLDDRFRLLTAGSRTASHRQQTLRAVVDWSYELLSAEEQHVLARLSTFIGGFTLHDASHVVGGDKVAVEEVDDVVLRLVDKSLVNVQTHQGSARFAMLQTLWDYAREKLSQTGDEKLVCERHARHFTELAEGLEPGFRSHGQRTVMDRLETEHDNLRAALQWAVEVGDRALAVRLLAAVGWFWFVRGHVGEGARWFQAVEALQGEVDPVPEARAARLAILLDLFDSRSDIPDVDRAVALARGTGDPEELAETLVVTAVRHARTGDVDAAIGDLERAAAIGAEAGNAWLQGTEAMVRSTLLSATHDVAEAAAAATRAVKHHRVTGDDWGLSMALMMRAASREAMGQYEAAMADFSEAHDSAERLGSTELQQHFLVHCGNLCTLAGDPASGRRHHEEAVAVARRVGTTQVLGMALNGVGLAARRLGDLDAATAAHDEAHSLYRAGGWLAGAALALAGMGFVAEQSGDADAASHHHLDSLELARRLGDERAVALACEGLAGAAALRGDHERAAELLGHADARRTRVGAPLPPGERLDVDRIEAVVVRAIGQERYEALSSTGATAELERLLSR